MGLNQNKKNITERCKKSFNFIDDPNEADGQFIVRNFNNIEIPY